MRFTFVRSRIYLCLARDLNFCKCCSSAVLWPFERKFIKSEHFFFCFKHTCYATISKEVFRPFSCHCYNPEFLISSKNIRRILPVLVVEAMEYGRLCAWYGNTINFFIRLLGIILSILNVVSLSRYAEVIIIDRLGFRSPFGQLLLRYMISHRLQI